MKEKTHTSKTYKPRMVTTLNGRVMFSIRFVSRAEALIEEKAGLESGNNWKP